MLNKLYSYTSHLASSMRQYACMVACLFILCSFSVNAIATEQVILIKTEQCKMKECSPDATKISLPSEKVTQHARVQESLKPLAERVSLLFQAVLGQDSLMQEVTKSSASFIGTKNKCRPDDCSYYFLRLNVLSSQAHPPTATI